MMKSKQAVNHQSGCQPEDKCCSSGLVPPPPQLLSPITFRPDTPPARPDPLGVPLHRVPAETAWTFHDHSWGNRPAVEGTLLLWWPKAEMAENYTQTCPGLAPTQTSGFLLPTNLDQRQVQYQFTRSTQRLCLLLFTCLLAVAASLPAFDIKNLHLLNGTLDEIMNFLPESSQLDNGDKHIREVRDIAPRPPAGHSWPKDCSEVPRGSRSGVYIIQPKGLHHLVVYCEMNVTNGGWTVIQRNQKDTPVTWAESWSTYKYGFGSVRTEYWLGTEYIHQIAKQKVYQVRFVIQDSTDNTNFADYNLFSVEDESHGYRLRLGSYTGTAGDAMTSDNPKTMHDNMKFSTKDRDQDTYSKNCAYSYEGGWWYSACYSVRLNFKGGMTWGSLCKGNCKSSLILIKPASYC
ncbi:angiopoietin-related protein 6-like [Opisthocomus hoazin]|uniref:angiopoietin-related protein 6-like n=1 Tax=Opisthocomus hoazin TaxID=30419 RepID=UPI003F53C84F